MQVKTYFLHALGLNNTGVYIAPGAYKTQNANNVVILHDPEALPPDYYRHEADAIAAAAMAIGRQLAYYTHRLKQLQQPG